MKTKIILIALLVFLTGCGDNFYRKTLRKQIELQLKADKICQNTLEYSKAYRVEYWNETLIAHCLPEGKLTIKFSEQEIQKRLDEKQ